MNAQTMELLEQEIRKEQAFFNAPPAALQEALGLTRDVPLTIRFGPDIESHIIKAGKNVFSHNGESVTSKEFGQEFFAEIQTALDDILFSPHPNGGLFRILFPTDSPSVFQDGQTLEIRLAPAEAPDICAAFNTARTYISALTRQKGVDLFFGEGHWHTSVMQGDDDLLSRARITHQYAGAGLLIFQTLFPAFFIKPRMADMEGISSSFRGANKIACGGPRESLNWKTHISGNPDHNKYGGTVTVESRLAIHAPYQPVYLTMAAIRYGLTRQGVMPGRGDALFLPTQYDNPLRVTGSSGNYLKHLRETVRNMEQHPLIPAPLARALLAESIRSYEDHLALPLIKRIYGIENIKKIREELAEIPVPGTPWPPAVNTASPTPLFQ